jgi:tRNA-Thr(GGU) m(6)t(6)A37 methyltransferase TsaA
MSDTTPIPLRPVGRVESSLTDAAAAPRQADEGAPPAWLAFDPGVADALGGLAVGDAIVVLTWFDRARREVLTTRPRNDASRAEQGVFGTRSPDRPNPIGLHTVRITAIDGTRVAVDALEALDGTPILDVKPVLGPLAGR